MPSASDIAANILQVQERVSQSAYRAGRDPASVRIVAVSKTFPPENILQAYECGVRDFGENRVQEYLDKRPALRLPDARFHLIGHLQTNKVIQAMAFDWIQTVDSIRLADRLNKAAAKGNRNLPVLIEVKLGEEESKTGVPEPEVSGIAAVLVQLESLELRGLMTIPPFSQDPENARPYFRRLRQLRDRLQGVGLDQVVELSMGMSHDFPVAIEEGATIVRIGTAIFGPRNA